MTSEEIAEVRPRLLAFAGEMLGGLARSDQRAAGELYVRGLLTDGRRKSMQPMAERLGVDHQRLQQFITSSTLDCTQCGGIWTGPAGTFRQTTDLTKPLRDLCTALDIEPPKKILALNPAPAAS